MLNLLKHQPLKKDLPDDDTGPSQAGNVPPQSPPSTIHAFGTFVDTSVWALEVIMQLNHLIHM
jgi:hypothetical protein